MSLSFSSPASRDARARGAGVTAVLGPTNTGKTHLAIERMLAHSSGLIGLPLRLLAREVYNKVVDRVGAENVALVTGEEKIKPRNPRFWVSTVEAMPRDLDCAFVAIDEIQLGSDLDRGHVFTDRMLNRRGREETLVLGAATVRPMVERLLPGANIVQRPRLSTLIHSGDRKITRLPRRSAIVVFSADEVYAIAELIRRQRGGAAVVLGALSPRTRNAQVELYQSGDVDYLIATDAIGMGLNLDVDHVAFASDSKFDGYQFRRLNPSEMAQIAGRAGRAQRDGTFGTTGRCPPFDNELVHQLESHAFEPIRVLQWRNTDLDFSTIGALQASLSLTPTEQGLTRAPVAEDILVLEHAARDEEIRGMATSKAAVQRLWDVCQVPDYRKIAPASHAELIVTLYGFLMREGKIPADWFSAQVAQADRTDGDIDTLSNRIAHVRTWTFVANRPDWLADPEHWQAVARGVEDKLSDALHERLTERFVDRRTSVLMRRLRENSTLETEIKKTGEVVVEGHEIGRLDGFTFVADASAAGSEAKALQAAARSALSGEIDARATKLTHAPEREFVLDSDGTVRWIGTPVGKLLPGEDVLRPRLRVIADEQLNGASREAVQTRLELWLKTHIERLLGPLFALAAAEDITGIARGVAYQLIEALGVLERQKVAEEVKGLDQAARALLRKYGVRFGAYHLYLPALLKPAPRSLAAQLWLLKNGTPDDKGLAELQRLASSGRTSIPVDKDTPKPLYRTIGYRVCGERAIRVDILERLADLIRPAMSWREGSSATRPPGAFNGYGFTVTGAMTSLTGASGEDFASILRSLGYRMERRPKPPEAEKPAEAEKQADAAAAATEAAASTETAAVHDDVMADGEMPEVEHAEHSEHEAAEPASDEADAPVEAAAEAPAEAEKHVEAEPAAAEAVAAEPVAAEPVAAEPVAAETATEVVAAEAAPAEAATTETATPAEAAAPAAPAEPEMIEVWRPGRPLGERRPRDNEGRNRRPRHRGHKPGQAAAQPAGDGAAAAAAPDQAAASTDATPAGENGREHHQGRRKFHGRDREQGERRDGQAERHGKRDDNRKGRPERRDREDGGGRPPRRDRDRRDRDDNRPSRTWSSSEQKRGGKEPDPNSPFAKLLALKEQLEGNKR
ncbi:helicase-related protein [Rhodoplanes sp. Z2-YC6860]|uniref:helicase-related protein n=1 Tax=Rhodoplanes sp. Z2-YC6860 TaxID=674703 RepID=UPI00078D8EF5|nr:helicase-related protein [Rhodoplanes sp. Z2-YC6860]AMN39224.1 ATP-dependent DNA Helicase [Rhodoplanes sp. Z2-YC6860]